MKKMVMYSLRIEKSVLERFKKKCDDDLRTYTAVAERMMSLYARGKIKL